MKVQFVLPLTLLTSAMLVGFINIRKNEIQKQEKLSRFQDIRMRVTNDVMQEYQNDQVESQKQMEQTQSNLRNIGEEVNMLRTKAEKTKFDADICLGSKKSDADQLAALETNLNNVKVESKKEMAEMRREVNELKKQLADRSAVCNFLKETPDPIKTMCGIKDEPKPKEEPPKQEEKKAEPPKQEEKKAEPPKQEEKKAEPPKQEEKKAEPPKQEEKKAEPPKQEEKKAEPPKQEEKKAEPPKQEEKKAEPPKQEEQKA